MTKLAWWAIPTNVRRLHCLRCPCLISSRIISIPTLPQRSTTHDGRARRGHQTASSPGMVRNVDRDQGGTAQGVPFSVLVSNANRRVLRGPHVHAPQKRHGVTTSGAHPHRGGSRGSSHRARVSLAKENTMFITTLQKETRHGHVIGSRPPKTYAPRWGRRHKPFGGCEADGNRVPRYRIRSQVPVHQMHGSRGHPLEARAASTQTPDSLGHLIPKGI